MVAEQGGDAEHQHEQYIRTINAALAGPTRRACASPPTCAGATSARRGRPRAATTSSPRRCSASSTSTASSWSTTTSAPAASSRCASSRPASRWCSAWSRPRRARWRTRTTLKRRIDEAAKYVPLDQLCLSPQCGFSSTVEGNALTYDEQRRQAAPHRRDRRRGLGLSRPDRCVPSLQTARRRAGSRCATCRSPSRRPAGAGGRARVLDRDRGELRMLAAISQLDGQRPGWGFAGVLHSDVDGGPRLGRRVVGITERGAWAERVAVPRTWVAALPDWSRLAPRQRPSRWRASAGADQPRPGRHDILGLRCDRRRAGAVDARGRSNGCVRVRRSPSLVSRRVRPARAVAGRPRPGRTRSSRTSRSWRGRRPRLESVGELGRSGASSPMVDARAWSRASCSATAPANLTTFDARDGLPRHAHAHPGVRAVLRRRAVRPRPRGARLR